MGRPFVMPGGEPESPDSPRTDEYFMQLALAEAARGLGRTSPNPAVGCVIVRDGTVVGRGWHERAGTAHAEIHALAAAGSRARGATAYVTLEPCAHYGRTPPCTEALIEAGIAKVVVAQLDANPLVAGKGLARLQAAGVQVESGVLAAAAAELNEAYTHWIQTGLPFVWWKAATSLDGKIATYTGDSRWITGKDARHAVHELRNRLDAVLVGVGTVIADDPALTCRLPGGRDPAAIICDSLARTPPTARVFDRFQAADAAPVYIAVTPAAPPERVAALRASGATILTVPADPDGHVDLAALMAKLGEQQITSLLLEGGAEIAASFLAAGLVHKAWLFVAPKLIGGRHAPGSVGGTGAARLADVVTWQFTAVRQYGPDVLLEAYPERSDPVCSPVS